VPRNRPHPTIKIPLHLTPKITKGNKMNENQTPPAAVKIGGLSATHGSPASEIRNRIRAHKAYMRKAGIKRRSFMNGGLSGEDYSANKTLFALETELKKALE
jgi:hypothetical protein